MKPVFYSVLFAIFALAFSAPAPEPTFTLSLPAVVVAGTTLAAVDVAALGLLPIATVKGLLLGNLLAQDAKVYRKVLKEQF